MIHFKNSGFTLIEVLITLALIALTLTPLYLLESSLLKGVARSSWKIDRLMQVKTFLVDAHRAEPDEAQDFMLEKKLTKPSTTVKYELKKVGENSVFKKIPNLYREQVSWEWQQEGKKYNDSLITFTYKPKREES